MRRIIWTSNGVNALTSISMQIVIPSTQLWGRIQTEGALHDEASKEEKTLAKPAKEEGPTPSGRSQA
jgi:hypothetical protein